MIEKYEFEIHYGEIEEPLYLTNDKNYICDEMRDFMEELQLRAEKVQLVSMSADEARYRVYLIGAVEDLQDIVFDIADFIPQMRTLELVYLRGKSITFTGGL